MATKVKKGSKINFYKFVPVSESGSSSKLSAANRETISAVNTNTKAVNNLGNTVNGLAKVVTDIKKVQLGRLELAEKNKPKFKPNFTKQKGEKFTGFFKKLSAGRVPSFFEAILGLIGNLLKFFVVTKALKWLSNPANRKKVQTVLETIGKVVKFIADWAKFGVTNTIDGLYDLLKDDATFGERMRGLVKGLVGVGSLLLGVRWLSNPTKIITDFGGVLKLFYNSLVKGKAKLIMQALRFGLNPKTLLAAGVTVAAIQTYRLNQEGTAQDEEKAAQGKSRQEEMQEEGSGGGYNVAEPFGGLFAQGGKVNGQFAAGGWIKGPQSGYPGSLNGGRSQHFVGHGTEYVARKADGGAFVVPFDTPATRRQPNLTNKRLQEANRLGYKMPGFASGGNLDKQIYLHWTAGGYNHKKGPYHTTIQGDGSAYRAVPYDQHTNHTYRRNTGNVGISAAAMGGRPWIDYPPKSIQIENMAKEAAMVAKGWGWKPEHINIKRVMTHAEAGSNKDGRRPHDNYGPVSWGGTGERWDWWHLNKGDRPGTGGDMLRSKIRKYMGQGDLKEAPGTSPGSANERQRRNSPIQTEEYNLLQRLLVAEAGGEGLTGMAMVARSVLNRAGLIQKGIVSPGMFLAKSGSIRDVIMASGQYQPIRDGAIHKPMSERQLALAAKAIGIAQNEAALRGHLEAAGKKPHEIHKLLGATGFRTGAAFNDPSQNVNVTKLGNHMFNTAGNSAIKMFSSDFAGRHAPGSEPGVQQSARAPQRGLLGGLLPTPSSSRSMEQRQGLPAAMQYMQPEGQRPGFTDDGRFRPRFSEGRKEDMTIEQMRRQTNQRNAARERIADRTRAMVDSVMQQVAASNNQNREAILRANDLIQLVFQGKSQRSTQVVTGGGGGGIISGAGLGRLIGGSRGAAIGGSVAGLLNSFNNPLRGIFS